jgi:hypothetical protein
MVLVVPLGFGDVFVTGEAASRWAKVSGIGAEVEAGVEARSGVWSAARSFGLEEELGAGGPLGEETSGPGEGVRRELDWCPFGLLAPTAEREEN